MRNNGDGTFGVDLNRNYGYMWGYDNIGSSPVPGNETYRGPSAFSEPETKIIRDFCIDHNILVCINYHTYGSVLFYPWSYIKALPPDSTTFNNLIKVATNFNRYLNGQTLPSGHWLNYTLNGDATDWMYGETVAKNKIIALLPEVGLESDGFWPIPERIFPLVEENLYANIIYAWGVGVIDNPPYISKASLNLAYCRPLVDSIKITAVETNPENHTSNVYARVFTSNDSLINEIRLDQLDTSFTALFLINTTDEEFYKILLHQEGQDIPSKIFFGNNLRFTTAGPVILDSISIKKSFSLYNARPYIRNLGTTATIKNVTAKLTSNDPWITNLNSGPFSYPTLTPGVTYGSTANYSFRRIDSLFPGNYNFKVEIMWEGLYCWTDSIRVVTSIEDEVQQPITFTLEQNFPNPFNPTTTIGFGITEKTNVRLSVLNILGEEIRVLINEEKEGGYHSIDFNASDLPSGVYFYRIQVYPANGGAGNPESSSGQVFFDTKKMILLK